MTLINLLPRKAAIQLLRPIVYSSLWKLAKEAYRPNPVIWYLPSFTLETLRDTARVSPRFSMTSFHMRVVCTRRSPVGGLRWDHNCLWVRPSEVIVIFRARDKGLIAIDLLNWRSNGEEIHRDVTYVYKKVNKTLRRYVSFPTCLEPAWLDIA